MSNVEMKELDKIFKRMYELVEKFDNEWKNTSPHFKKTMKAHGEKKFQKLYQKSMNSVNKG